MITPKQVSPIPFDPATREAGYIDDLSEEDYQLMIASLRNGTADPALDELMEEEGNKCLKASS